MITAAGQSQHKPSSPYGPMAGMDPATVMSVPLISSSGGSPAATPRQANDSVNGGNYENNASTPTMDHYTHGSATTSSKTIPNPQVAFPPVRRGSFGNGLAPGGIAGRRRSCSMDSYSYDQRKSSSSPLLNGIITKEMLKRALSQYSWNPEGTRKVFTKLSLPVRRPFKLPCYTYPQWIERRYQKFGSTLQL